MSKKESKGEAIELRSAHDVMVALRRRYPSPEYAFFEDVANAVGLAQSRRADAVAMGLWKTRGISVHGFEIKVSRQDVRRELADPKKADAIATYCDFWWLVVGSASIVRPDELPETWGLLVPVRSGESITMRVAVKAKPMKPKPLDRLFVAELLKKGAAGFDPESIRKEVRQEIYADLHSTITEREQSRHADKIAVLQNERNAAMARAEKAEAALADALGPMFSAEQALEILALAKRLKGWNGAGGQLDRAESMLQRAAETMRDVSGAVASARQVVRMLSGMASEAAPEEG